MQAPRPPVIDVRAVDKTYRLGAIRVPTLVLCGREDRATEPVHSERNAQAIPGAKLVWIEGAGHRSALEKPREVTEHLVNFVRSV